MKKNLRNGLYSLIVLGTLFSCVSGADDDTFNTEEQSIAYFSESNITLFVREEGTSTVDVSVGATRAIDSERTFTVEVNEDASTAVEGVDYMGLNLSNLTIAAGQQFGTFTVTAGSFDVATLAGKNLVLDLIDVENALIRYKVRTTIKIIKFCPLEAPFTGDYLIEELTPFVDGPTLNHQMVVTLYDQSENEELGETDRAFLTSNYIDYCSTPNEFVISFVCGFVEFPGEGNRSNCTCGGTLLFANPEVPQAFDPADDSEFLITFTNDPLQDCGAPVQTTYRFTKQ